VSAARAKNPFPISGVVTGGDFTDRETETARVRRALDTPQDFLLVYGPRRMGKTSLLRVVQEEMRAVDRPVVLVDLSTAGSLAEMTTRLLQAATRELGRAWRDVATELVQRLRAKVTFEPDPSGIVLPSLDIGLGEADLATQRATFAGTLDAIEALAAAREKPLGVIIDEFQEIHRFGGETAEAHLRGVIQHHRHVRYVLAGSDERLITAMIGSSRPFYKLLTPLHVGPIDPAHLAGWIEQRMRAAGLHMVDEGVGALIVHVAGPRTRDVVQLAHEAFELGRPSGEVTATTVEAAFTRVVRGSDAPYRALWSSCTRVQQQVLRALAVRMTGLTSAAVRREFGLGASQSGLTRAAQALVARDILAPATDGYAYDDPFMRGWVIIETLPDLGRTLPVLHVPEGDR
jgi:hypothetical protein